MIYKRNLKFDPLNIIDRQMITDSGPQPHEFMGGGAGSVTIDPSPND